MISAAIPKVRFIFPESSLLTVTHGRVYIFVHDVMFVSLHDVTSQNSDSH